MAGRPAVRMHQAELFEGPQRTWRNREFREAVQPAPAALTARTMTVREEVNDDPEERGDADARPPVTHGDCLHPAVEQFPGPQQCRAAAAAT